MKPTKTFLSAFFLTLSCCMMQLQAQIWSNEIHYQNTGEDINERIELAGPAGASLSGWSVVLYDGSTGQTYGNTITLTGTLSAADCTVNGLGIGLYVIDVLTASGGFAFQGGGGGFPDGWALIHDGMAVELYSYGGTFTATNGPANGMTSTDIGTEEPATTADNSSIQRTGATAWAFGEAANTFGACNSTQYNAAPPCTPPTAAISIAENIVSGSFGVAYYNASLTDGILCTGPAVPSPSTSATLTASGGGTYLWSTNATTASITVSAAGTYTVVVTSTPGCTSSTSKTITVSAAPSAGTISATPLINAFGNLGVCYGSTIDLNSTVSGGEWYTISHNPTVLSVSNPDGIVTPLLTTASVDSQSVFYKVTNGGCNNVARTTVTVVDPKNPGTISGNTNLCPGNTSQLTSNGQSGGVWKSSDTNVAIVSTTGLVTPLNNGTTTISYTLYGIPPTTCPYSATALVTVAPCCADPVARCIAATVELTGSIGILYAEYVDHGSTAACGLQSMTVSPDMFNCGDVGTPQTVTLTVTDINNSSSQCTTTVTVVDDEPPSVTCKPATVNLDANGTGSITTASVFASGSDNCGTVNQVSVAPNTFTCSNLGANTVVLTVNDGHGNTATCNATVTVVDVTPPNIICDPNVTVNTSQDGSGDCYFGGFAVGYDIADNCTNPLSVHEYFVFQDGSIVKDAVFSPTWGRWLADGSFPAGVTTAYLTVTDAAGLSSSCSNLVTVIDNEPPSVTCKSATVNLSAAGTGSITTASVFGSGSDNCGTVNQVSVTPNTFTCSNLGPNTVVLTVNDGHGNTATCNAIVTVTDAQPPSITCPANISTTNTTGLCSATVTYTAPVGTDNCSGVSTAQTSGSASGASFPVGTTTNVYTVTASNGQTATCSFTVTVTDAQPPSINCPANISVNNTTGLCSAAVTYTAPTVTDNCSGANTAQTAGLASGASFPVGTTTNVYTVTTSNGQTATCSFTVTVTDVEPLSVTCKPATVNLSAAGTGSITTASVFASGSDNCGTVNQVSVTPNAFTCSNLGANTVVLTVNDGHGNTATCNAIVTVLDMIPPSVTCKPATVNLSAAGTGSITTASVFASGSDNCGTVNQVSVSPNAFTCSNLGPNTVVLTVNDGHGNTATCNAIVTVVDVTPPSIICDPNITINTSQDTTGDCYFRGGGAFSTIVDNCTNPLLVHIHVVFPNNSIGDVARDLPWARVGLRTNYPTGVTTVHFTATDAAGLSSSCSQLVTVIDDELPQFTFVPSNTTVECNAVPAISTPTASDNCGATVSFLNEVRTAGICPVYYTLTRTWRAADASGNSTTAVQVITVKDTQAPVFTHAAQSVTMECGPDNQAQFQQWLADNGGAVVTDCNTITWQNNSNIAPVYLGCQGILDVTIVFRATDGCGNFSTSKATFKVRDTQPPQFVNLPENISIECNAQWESDRAQWLLNFGNAVITDNCTEAVSIEMRTVGQSQNECSVPATFRYRFIATDDCGNTAEREASFTVTDTEPARYTGPDTIRVACENDIPTPQTLRAAIREWIDDCGNSVTVHFEYDSGIPKSAPKYRTFGFWLEDGQGNQNAPGYSVTWLAVGHCNPLCTAPQEVWGDTSGTIGTETTKRAIRSYFKHYKILRVGLDCRAIQISRPECITTLLPGEGATASIPQGVFGNDECYFPNYLVRQNQSLNNPLAANAIALTLNIWHNRVYNDRNLFNLDLKTLPGCLIDDLVLAQLGNNTGVQDLLDLANQYLGLQGNFPPNFGVKLNNTLQKLNNYWNNCIEKPLGCKAAQHKSDGEILGATDLKLVPNPAGNYTQLQYFSEAEQAVTISVFDVAGRMLAQHYMMAVRGENTAQIPLDAFASGLYTVSLNTSQKVETLKLVIAKE